MSNPLPDGIDRWHHHHNKPQHDLILITTNRTGYRVSSTFLSKHSVGFKDSESEPITIDDDVKPDLSPRTLEVDLDDSALDLFLDLIAVTTPSQVQLLARSPYKQCRQLYQFSDEHRCEEVKANIYKRLIQSARYPGEPTDLFLFASERKDWVLGRNALKKMDSKEVSHLFGRAAKQPQPRAPRKSAPRVEPAVSPNVSRIEDSEQVASLTFFDKLPSNWQSVLMKLLVAKGYEDGKLVEDWSTIASGFKAPRTKIPAPRRPSDQRAGGSKRIREN